ncbi:MarR family winged helix-turn-helix transcriptional regulator [Actinotalea sp.]|uniref:MarR family winged helix-turn-helix transcriptional regulator n=1 Tax=Actinotalea sp. TaxID=1872145 RepID=UPI0035652A35
MPPIDPRPETGQDPALDTRVRPAQCRPTTLAGSLRVAVTRATRRLRLERSSEQITDGQYAALAALANRGPMTPTVLAEDQHVQGPPMSRIVARLVDAGLARRDEHPTDGRQVVISVTEAGMAEVTETRRRRNVWLEARLAELTPADREVLARAAVLLDRIATQ